MNINDFALEIANRERGKKQVDLAQIKEILGIINKLTKGVFYAFIKFMAIGLMVAGIHGSVQAANPLVDQVKATLLDNIEPMTQIQSGKVSVALLDSVFLIGKYHGEYISSIQGGIASETQVSDGPEWIAGYAVYLDPFVRPHLITPEHWKFLSALRYGPAIHYNFSDKVWRASLNVSLAFELNPKQ